MCLVFFVSAVFNLSHESCDQHDFFNQVQSIRILYLCKSITEAAWKYLCKSPDSSQALFSHLSFFILSHPDPPLPAFVIPLVHLISKSARLPVTICRPSFIHFSSVWGNCPNHESKEAVLISNLSFTCSLNYKGKKILWFIFHIALVQLSGQEVTWQVISPISQPRVYQSS